MWKLILALCALPHLALATALADFDQGQLASLGGPLRSQNLILSLGEASPLSAQGHSLQLRSSLTGPGASSLQAQLPPTLSLDLVNGGNRDGGPRVDLASLSSSRQLSVLWKAGAAGTQCQVCLVNSNWTGPLCSTLVAKGSGWQEDSISLEGPGPLEVGSLSLRLQAPAGSALDLMIDEIRLASVSNIPASAVAQAFGASEAQVHSLRRAGLPEGMNWMLLLMQTRCGCSLQSLLAQRATKHWGEIASSAGWSWPELVREKERLADAAALGTPEDSVEQLDKLARNDAFSKEKP